MRYDDPNRLDPPLKNLRPKPRYLQPDDPSDAAHSGYDRIARRPRTGAFSEIVPEERADRIEEIFSDMGPFDMDSY